jgi:class II lanthipeptide synthase
VGVTPLPATTSLLSLSGEIADTLAETAIRAGERCTWLSAGVDLSSGSRRVVHRTADPSVYQGDSGIAWALVHAGAALGRADLQELARAGAFGALGRADLETSRGLHDGASGVAIATFQVGVALGDEELMARALDLLAEATSEPLPLQDIVSGNAGAIAALMAAYDETRDPRLLQRAMDLGQALLDTAERRPWGWAWRTGPPDEPGLCGLAHGAGGIAWALGELDARAEGTVFGRAIREALRYERSWFDRQRSNWPDLRAGTRLPNGERPYPTWWCHGAVGAGLVRLRLHDLGRDEPILLAEAGAALQSGFADATASIDDGRLLHYGLTVCHGLGGAIELLLTVRDVLDEREHVATARWLLDRAVAVLGGAVERWPDGIGASAASPSLMTGMAGTLVVLLRAADVGPLPSVGLFPCSQTSRRAV